ncbi:MAG: YggS family pyridoxal phosphate-dependent enzyme [Veillonellales bacterium]
MSIAHNYQAVLHNVSVAQAKRTCAPINNAENVKVVAVTKNHDVQAMLQAIDAGVIAVGENRIQEAQQKFQAISPGRVERHLIGHLQTNKVRQAVSLFDLIHSVDSERLAVAMNRIAEKLSKRQDILLQVNVAQEDTKFGIAVHEVADLAAFVTSSLPYLRLCGLMIIAPFFPDKELTRPIFRKGYQLFQELLSRNLPSSKLQWLSMGMSNDYEIAIEEGANLIRVGTGIFGARQY